MPSPKKKRKRWVINSHFDSRNKAMETVAGNLHEFFTDARRRGWNVLHVLPVYSEELPEATKPRFAEVGITQEEPIDAKGIVKISDLPQHLQDEVRRRFTKEFTKDDDYVLFDHVTYGISTDLQGTRLFKQQGPTPSSEAIDALRGIANPKNLAVGYSINACLPDIAEATDASVVLPLTDYPSYRGLSPNPQSKFYTPQPQFRLRLFLSKLVNKSGRVVHAVEDDLLNHALSVGIDVDDEEHPMAAHLTKKIDYSYPLDSAVGPRIVFHTAFEILKQRLLK